MTEPDALHPARPRHRYRRSARAAGPHPLSRLRARRSLGLRRRASITCATSSPTGATGFDWRAQEARLNAFPQFKCRRTTSTCTSCTSRQGPNPMPLLLMHGWPGSVFEFLEIIPRLTDPAVSAAIRPTPSPSWRRRCPATACRSGRARSASASRRSPTAGRTDDERSAMSASRCRAATGAASPPRCMASACRQADRHPRQFPRRAARPERRCANPTPSKALPRESGALAGGRDGLSVDPGHEAADAQLRADRFPRRARRLDRREIPRLDGLRRRRRDARSRRDQMLANISFYWFTGAIGSSFFPYYFRRRRAGRSRRRPVTAPTGYAAVPERDPAPAALAGGEDVHRHPPLDRDAEAAAISPRWSSRTRSPTTSGVLPRVALEQEVGPPRR